MKSKRFTSDDERLILTGIIVNSTVLRKIVSGLDSEKKPFASKWSNQIFHWCRVFHLKYNKAPRAIIQSLFRAYANKQPDEDTTALMEKFLTTLSEDYKTQSKETNVDYIVDLASRYFNEVRLNRFKDELEENLSSRDVEAAQLTIAKLKPVSFQMSAVIDVFTDKEAWREAIEAHEDQILINYPGALGEFFGPHLQRDGFIAFLAPEKRGKSWWLIDMAWRSVRERRKTFFFAVGDMSKRQMLQRFGIRAMRRPMKEGTIKIPKSLIKPDDGAPIVKLRHDVYDRPIRTSEWLAVQKQIHSLTASHDSVLKLSCTANATTKVSDIELALDEEIKNGWIPDVVIIDYADILSPETNSKGQDFRHATNETWQAMRRVSQKYHCLVVTATQSDAASYDAVVIRKKNFSEDKRKAAHVTGMLGINQTEEEKEQGLYRLNWIFLREGASFENKCVTVAGCLAIANPAIKSCW